MTHKLRPERIVWRDAYAVSDTWIDEHHQFGDEVIVTTVGYVISGGPKGYVTIADSWYVADGVRWYGGVSVVPDGMIVSRSRL